MSLTPIVLGTVVCLVAIWWVVAAVNHPYVDPSAAPGQEVAASDEQSSIPVPPDLDGWVVVYATPRHGGLGLGQEGVDCLVVDPPPVCADEPGLSDLRTQERFERVGAVWLGADTDHAVSVPAGWSGRVSFVTAEDPPYMPDWRTIVPGAIVAVVAAGVAITWTVRRTRWRADLVQYKADMRAAGYDVD